MITQTIVKREDLLQLWGSHLPVFEREFRFGNYTRYPINDLPAVIVIEECSMYPQLDQGLLAQYQYIEKRENGLGHCHLLLLRSMVHVVEREGVSDIVRKVLEDFMPGRYHIRQRGNNLTSIYLYYPEFTIRNTAGQEHKIYDLVARLEIHEINGLRKRITGTRYTFTRKEVSVGYLHSHLSPAAYVINGNYFCTGGSSDFTKMLEAMSGRTTPENFALFLIQFEQYLQWESMEGSPYIYMSSINSPKNEIDEGELRQGDESDEICSDIAERFLDEITEDMLFRTIDGMYRINPGLYDQKWFDAERRVVQKLELEWTDFGFEDVVGDYNVESHSYVVNSYANMMPDVLPDEDQELIRVFKIQPKIIEVNEDKVTPDTVVKRLLPGTLRWSLEKLNNMLAEAYKLNPDENYTVITESKDSNINQTGSADRMPAQPVPDREGVEWATSF